MSRVSEEGARLLQNKEYKMPIESRIKHNRLALYVEIKKALFNKFTRYCKKNKITKLEATELALKKLMKDMPQVFDIENIKL